MNDAIVRNDIITNQLKQAKITFPVTRFEAIEGKHHIEKNNGLSNGQWGCWLSHMSLLEESASELTEHLLILEDDEEFNSDLNLIESLIKDLPENIWDIIYLDLTAVETEDYLFLTRELKKSGGLNKIVSLPRNFTAYGTHAYVVNKLSKRKIITLLKKNCQKGLPIDNVFSALHNTYQINSFACIPFLTGPNESTENSQINTSAHPLESSWIKFRKFMYDKKFSNDPNKRLIEIINERLNFSLTEQFHPLRSITLNTYSEPTNEEGEIPKIIHVVWVGSNIMPTREMGFHINNATKLSDYTFKVWGNFEVNELIESNEISHQEKDFLKSAIRNKKWAFISDYIKLYALKKYGGFSIDSDNEIIRTLDNFRHYGWVTGFENWNEIKSPVTAVMGAKKAHPLTEILINIYKINAPETIFSMPNTQWISKIFIENGAIQDDSEQHIEKLDLHIFPSEIFCGPSITENTVSLHHFTASWK